MNSRLKHFPRTSGWRATVPVNNTSIRGKRARYLLAGIAFLTLAALAITTSAQDSAFPAASSVLQPKAYVSLQPVPAGRAFEIAVVAKISPGFHINAHMPSEDYLIPTKITADLPPGVLLVEATYPHGVM